MNKRLIIFASTGAVILVLIAGLLFWAVQKQKQTAPVPVATVQMKKILDESVISPVASFDNTAIWYFTSAGRLFRVNLDGSGLSEFPLPALASTIRQALWPKTGSDFIAITGSGANETKNYYNSVKKIYISLPLNIKSLDWLSDSQRVVYIWQSGDNQHQQLVEAGADGTGFTKIADVYWPDLLVKASPDGKTALLYRSSIQGDTNKIYQVDLGNGNITTAISSGKNLGAVWVPGKNKFVFAQSSFTAYPKLYLYDLVSQQAVDLNLNTTLDKVTFDSTGQYLYAAVPKKDNTGDTFMKENLTNFKQDTFFDPGNNTRGINLLVAGTGSLYFTNTADQRFYTISK